MNEIRTYRFLWTKIFSETVVFTCIFRFLRFDVTLPVSKFIVLQCIGFIKILIGDKYIICIMGRVHRLHL